MGLVISDIFKVLVLFLFLNYVGDYWKDGAQSVTDEDHFRLNIAFLLADCSSDAECSEFISRLHRYTTRPYHEWPTPRSDWTAKLERYITDPRKAEIFREAELPEWSSKNADIYSSLCDALRKNGRWRWVIVDDKTIQSLKKQSTEDQMAYWQKVCLAWWRNDGFTQRFLADD